MEHLVQLIAILTLFTGLSSDTQIDCSASDPLHRAAQLKKSYVVT